MRDSQISLSGGRQLAYTDIGQVGAPCVFFFHGAPSSRLGVAYLEPSFQAAGLRIVSPDRPSYGGSSPQPGRSLVDWPADVGALADALGVEHFIVAGHSSGGPYAVACAALLPERVSAGVIFAGVTNMAWEGAWQGCSPLEGQLMRLPDEEAALASCIERFGVNGSRFAAAFDWEVPEPDIRLYADEEILSVLAAANAEAFRQGVVGYAQDMYVQGQPWPFDPAAITVPVHLVHGELDTVVAPAHSRHTAELIPESTLHMLPGHGHLTIMDDFPAMGSTLARLTI
jgi:pimeloyl-ACP methyl ester carboxylesterase